MPDDKKVDDKKTSEKPKHEFEELKDAEGNAIVIGSLLSVVTKIPGIEHAYGLANRAEIQYRHALIPADKIKAGEGKNFQEAFDRLYQNQSLPEIKTPTNTGLFIVEDTPKTVNEKVPFVHGHGVTAYATAASRALTGKEYPVQLLNRLPLEGDVGKTWIGTRKEKNGSSVREIGADFAAPILNYDFNKNTTNVFSASLVANNLELKTHENRVEGAKKISDYFGNYFGNYSDERSLFVVASGNKETQKDPSMKHNALRHHPNTLLVGAATAWEHIGIDGKKSHSFGVTDYSTSGPDVVMVAAPAGARYQNITDEGMRSMPLHGTSLATPQAAAVVANLARRFVASEENPEAKLSGLDVLLAIKNTAQPVHSVIYDKLAYDVTIEPPTETRFGRTSTPFRVSKVGQNFVSLEAGNGIIDPRAAWELLEKQEIAVAKGEAKTLPRKDIAVSAKPVSHSMAARSSFKNVPDTAPSQMYSYTLDVAENLHADQIVLDMQSLQMSSKLFKEPPERRPKLYLVSPSGDAVEVAPSSGFGTFGSTETNAKQTEENPQVFGRAAGMQGLAMKGKWTVLSTEQLKELTLNFDNAMEPDHVGVSIVPDAKERERQLYRHTDFAAYTPEQIEALFKPDSFIYAYDLTEAGFPPHYTTVKLAKLAEKDKATATKLLEARYGKHPEHDAIAKAVEEGDGKKILDALVPEKEKFAFIRDLAATESKESLLFLIDKGFAKVKDENVPEGTNPSTAFIEVVKRRGSKMEPEVVNAFLKAGSDPKAQDAKGRTVLHYARNAQVQKMLMDTDLNGPIRPRLYEIKDNDGKKYSELPHVLDLSMSLPDNNRYVAEAAELSDVMGANVSFKLPNLKVKQV